MPGLDKFHLPKHLRGETLLRDLLQNNFTEFSRFHKNYTARRPAACKSQLFLLIVQKGTSLIIFGPLERVRVFEMIVEMIYSIFRHCATFLENIFGQSVVAASAKRSFCDDRGEELISWIWSGTNHHDTSSFYLLRVAGPEEGEQSCRTLSGPSL